MRGKWRRHWKETCQWQRETSGESTNMQTLNSKKSAQREESCHVNPLHHSDDEVLPFLDQLQHDIVQWNEINDKVERKVTGGSLHQL